jgi:phosphorylcholine metabolism protein LicD
MIGGTLLGCVRDNSIIKWDDDGDLLVFNIEKQDLLNILNELTKIDIKIMINMKGLITLKFKDKEGSVDIFLANKNVDKNNVIYKFQFPYNLIYSKEYFNHSEIFPLKNYILGPIILKGPNNPYPYLFRTYDNWKNNIKWNSKSFF